MYHIYVTYTARDNGVIHQFFEEVKASGVIEASRAEEGNICYDYYFSAEKDNQMLLIEKWREKEDQVHHSTLPHFAKLGEIKKKYGIETALEVV